MTDGLRACPQCGKQFVPNTTNQRFCNLGCGKAHVKARKNKKAAIEELEQWRKENGKDG